MSESKQFDGSQRHLLDWIESPNFLDTIREWIRPQGLRIQSDARWIPQSWSDPSESRLFDSASPFLRPEQKTELRKWWLVHPGNIPNWDLIIDARTEDHRPALVLVEAKAHSDEFDCGPKSRPDANNPRSVENHDRIENAILEANFALSQQAFRPSISCDHCYQLSNRIAFAWKLASMGITIGLIFLGFTGDREIKKEGLHFSDDSHWQRAFGEYSAASFPLELVGRSIPCGAASFFVLSQSLPVARSSRPYAERKRRPKARTP